MSILSSNSTAAGEETTGTAAGLIPADIAFLIEERPLLWYEDPREYDGLQRSIFRQLAPDGALNYILAKSVVDYAWEFRRMKKLKHTAINFAMPDAAAKLLAPGEGLWVNPERSDVREQGADVAYGAKEATKDGKPSFAERMEEMRITPEMIHYKALNSSADPLAWINDECERLEDRFHRLLRDYEGRNKTLAAMARALVEREKAQDADFREVN